MSHLYFYHMHSHQGDNVLYLCLLYAFSSGWQCLIFIFTACILLRVTMSYLYNLLYTFSSGWQCFIFIFTIRILLRVTMCYLYFLPHAFSSEWQCLIVIIYYIYIHSPQGDNVLSIFLPHAFSLGWQCLIFIFIICISSGWQYLSLFLPYAFSSGWQYFIYIFIICILLRVTIFYLYFTICILLRVTMSYLYFYYMHSPQGDNVLSWFLSYAFCSGWQCLIFIFTICILLRVTMSCLYFTISILLRVTMSYLYFYRMHSPQGDNVLSLFLLYTFSSGQQCLIFVFTIYTFSSGWHCVIFVLLHFICGCASLTLVASTHSLLLSHSACSLMCNGVFCTIYP